MIRELWPKACTIARRDAEAEMGRGTDLDALSWDEVFTTACLLDRKVRACLGTGCRAAEESISAG